MPGQTTGIKTEVETIKTATSKMPTGIVIQTMKTVTTMLMTIGIRATIAINKIKRNNLSEILEVKNQRVVLISQRISQAIREILLTIYRMVILRTIGTKIPRVITRDPGPLTRDQIRVGLILQDRIITLVEGIHSNNLIQAQS